MFPHPHILIVDDDEDIRFAIRLTLEEAGYIIQEASDGVDAVQQMHASMVPLVVITDHRMPHLDGPGLIKVVASEPELSRRHQMVYCTANSEQITPDVHAVLQYLHAPILTKPFNTTALVQLVQHTIEQMKYHQLTAALTHAISEPAEAANQKRPVPPVISDGEQYDEHVVEGLEGTC